MVWNPTGAPTQHTTIGGHRVPVLNFMGGSAAPTRSQPVTPQQQATVGAGMPGVQVLNRSAVPPQPPQPSMIGLQTFDHLDYETPGGFDWNNEANGLTGPKITPPMQSPPLSGTERASPPQPFGDMNQYTTPGMFDWSSVRPSPQPPSPMNPMGGGQRNFMGGARHSSGDDNFGPLGSGPQQASVAPPASQPVLKDGRPQKTQGQVIPNTSPLYTGQASQYGWNPAQNQQQVMASMGMLPGFQTMDQSRNQWNQQRAATDASMGRQPFDYNQTVANATNYDTGGNLKQGMTDPQNPLGWGNPMNPNSRTPSAQSMQPNMSWLTGGQQPQQTQAQSPQSQPSRSQYSGGSVQRTSQTTRNGQAGPMQSSFQQFGDNMGGLQGLFSQLFGGGGGMNWLTNPGGQQPMPQGQPTGAPPTPGPSGGFGPGFTATGEDASTARLVAEQQANPQNYTDPWASLGPPPDNFMDRLRASQASASPSRFERSPAPAAQRPAASGWRAPAPGAPTHTPGGIRINY